jgi:hypothetical protein
MREEIRLERIEREILRSRKWQRFVRAFDIGKKPKQIKALPIRFVFYIPGDGKLNDHTFMLCLQDEIQVSIYFYQATQQRIVKAFLTHELVHHYLRTNNVAYMDRTKLFNKALGYLNIDLDIMLTVKWRRRGGKDNGWKYR